MFKEYTNTEKIIKKKMVLFNDVEKEKRNKMIKEKLEKNIMVLFVLSVSGLFFLFLMPLLMLEGNPFTNDKIITFYKDLADHELMLSLLLIVVLMSKTIALNMIVFKCQSLLKTKEGIEHYCYNDHTASLYYALLTVFSLVIFANLFVFPSLNGFFLLMELGASFSFLLYFINKSLEIKLDENKLKINDVKLSEEISNLKSKNYSFGSKIIKKPEEMKKISSKIINNDFNSDHEECSANELMERFEELKEKNFKLKEKEKEIDAFFGEVQNKTLIENL